MPFAATWIDLEIINTKWSRSERKIQVPYDITYVWNLKKHHSSELIYKAEIDSYTLKKKTKTTYYYQKLKGQVWDKLGVWD